MIEKSYNFSVTDQKTIERLIEDEHVMINHLVLPQGEALPEHHADSRVHMIVLRGRLTLKLEGCGERSYPAGSIVEIPYQTLMHPQNRDDTVLEFFVIKTPSPRTMRRQQDS